MKQAQQKAAPLTTLTGIPQQLIPTTPTESALLLERLNEALTRGQGRKIKAYSCQRFQTQGCTCIHLYKELGGQKVYWYQGRPWTLNPGSGFGDERAGELDLDAATEPPNKLKADSRTRQRPVMSIKPWRKS